MDNPLATNHSVPGGGLGNGRGMAAPVGDWDPFWNTANQKHSEAELSSGYATRVAVALLAEGGGVAVGEVVEPGVLVGEGGLDDAGRAGSLFGDDDLGDS